jgi:hypothetical protein
MSENCVVVSRHPAALEFIACSLSTEGIEGRVCGDRIDFAIRPDLGDHFDPAGTLTDSIPVIRGDAIPDDVAGKHVYGNVPLCLAALAHRVTVIEFTGKPPRGQEYTLADMLSAGARLTDYCVVTPADLDRIRCGAIGDHYA